MPTVIPMAPVDMPRVVDTLQQSAYDDPVVSFVLPDENSRRWRLVRLFSLELVSHYAPLSSAWTTPDYAGAALWSPPGSWRRSRVGLAHQALPMTRVFGRHLGRMLRSSAAIDNVHPAEPHWYLAAIAVVPRQRHVGLGSALLVPVLGRCDHDRVGAYVECSQESNLAFYRHHGFEVTNRIRLGGGPALWGMWRDPGSG
jgi:GNAT superfamily N-acetyltransferase